MMPCASGTHIPREASGLARAEGVASVLNNLMEVTFFWSQGQPFGDGRVVDTHPSSTVDLLCDLGQVSLPLWIVVCLILNRKIPPSPVVVGIK